MSKNRTNLNNGYVPVEKGGIQPSASTKPQTQPQQSSGGKLPSSGSAVTSPKK